MRNTPRISISLSAERDERGGWAIRCGEALCEIVPHGDRYGAHELRMPKAGFRIQRKLAEAAALTLIDEGWVRAGGGEAPWPEPAEETRS